MSARLTVEDVARAVDVPVELLTCSVADCTSRRTFHHHHDALTRQPSPLACRCNRSVGR